MLLSKDQIAKLLNLIASTQSTKLDCDGCLEHVAQYADDRLAGHDLCEAMRDVESHLADCPCCQHEFESFLEALRGMEACDRMSCPTVQMRRVRHGADTTGVSVMRCNWNTLLLEPTKSLVPDGIVQSVS